MSAGNLLGIIGSGFGPIGYFVGTTIGNLLFPTDLGTVEGQRLSDEQRNSNSNAFGSMIPKVQGKIKVQGQVIWGPQLKEVKTATSVGKGGPSQTQITYTYYADFAVALAAGENEIIKIWADTVLIYNGELRDSTLSEAISRSKIDLDYVTVYTGTETQMPDPLIESYEGVGNVPAHRGLTYIVFENMPLEEYGNRRPIISAEIVNVGAYTEVYGSAISHYSEYINTGGGIKEGHCAYVDPEVITFFLNQSFGSITFDQKKVTLDGNSYVDNIDSFPSGANYGGFLGHSDKPYHIQENATFGTPFYMMDNFGNVETYYTNNDPITALGFWSRYKNEVFMVGSAASYYYTAPGNPTAYYTDNAFNSAVKITENYIYGARHVTNTITIYRIDKSFVSIETLGSYTFSGAGYYTAMWLPDDESYILLWNQFTLRRLDIDTGVVTGIKTWSNTDSSLCYTGSKGGLTNGCALTQINKTVIFCGNNSSGAYMNVHYISQGYSSTAASGITLASSITEICADVGLTSNDIDLTELNNDPVEGYLISQVTARDSITPLMQAYHFDCYESDFKLKFKSRNQ